MKIEFLTNDELNVIVEEIMEKEVPCNTCEVGYSVAAGTDVVSVYDLEGQLVKEVTVENLTVELGQYLNIKISRYDVIEVGESEGFAFFF